MKRSLRAIVILLAIVNPSFELNANALRMLGVGGGVTGTGGGGGGGSLTCIPGMAVFPCPN
jgi:hypothetical protein